MYQNESWGHGLFDISGNRNSIVGQNYFFSLTQLNIGPYHKKFNEEPGLPGSVSLLGKDYIRGLFNKKLKVGFELG